jgi:diguanylate cyclase (GGDEF)-like protein
VHLARTPDEIENERKRLLIYSFSILGNILTGTFGVVSLINARYVLGAILLFCVVGVSILAYITTRLKSAQPVCLFLAGMQFMLACYLTLAGGAEGTGPYWSYGITMLMVLLVGPKIGIVYMSTYLVIIGVGLFGDHPSVYPYSEIEATRIFAASISLYVLVLASEWIRMMSYGAITLTSEGHRQLANTDPLTQLLNRYGLQSELRAKPAHAQGVVALLDVDHFKSINDNFGHDAGDQVLVKLANILQQHTKGRDVVARWGGEEFLLILFDTPLDLAANLVQKIQATFKKESFDFNGKITFSAGLAIMTGIAEFEAVIKTADARLYQAKNGGRDQVVSSVA